MTLDLSTVYEAVLVVGVLGPLLALGGHGSIAWVAIRRFFSRVSRRISEVEALATSVGQRVDAVSGVVLADVRAVEARLDARLTEVRGSMLAELTARLDALPPVPTIAEIQASLPSVPTAAEMAASLQPQLDDMGKRITMTLLSQKAALLRKGEAAAMDLAEATDPEARALIGALGRRRGKRALSFLEAARSMDAAAHPELHPEGKP